MLLTDRTPQQTSSPTTPTDIFRTSTLIPSNLQLRDEDDNAAEIDEELTTPMSIRDRLAAAEERGDTTVMNRSNFRNPLDKYTNNEMEDVHYNHPMAALKFTDFETITSWENIKSGKLLAQPFGSYANKIENHKTLKALIFAAVAEITNAVNISVCAPRRNPSAKRNPSSFLIHNLTEKQKQTLLARRGVWSSTNITFRVMPLEPACPDFLFLIKGFTDGTEETVYNAVKEVWNDAATIAFMDSICNIVPENLKEHAALALQNFKNALRVKLLETKHKGGGLAPTFQVYASGASINEDRTWCQLRSYLASREYAIPFEDPGTIVIPAKECTICHGADHPRGLCPFPNIAGWNGPKGKEDDPLIDPRDGRRTNEQPANRDRYTSRESRA